MRCSPQGVIRPDPFTAPGRDDGDVGVISATAAVLLALRELLAGPEVCAGAAAACAGHLPPLRRHLQHGGRATQLRGSGVRQLYPKGPNIDYKKELKALNRELQLYLLELADVLVERPSQYARRVEEISLIFKNLHHLLNSLRPHQARATLIHILELQIQRRKQAIEDVKKRREEAQRLLKESLQILDGHSI